MKGRDKRRKAKERKENNRQPEKLLACQVLNGLADETTCHAEQRFQKSMNPNGCKGCLRYDNHN